MRKMLIGFALGLLLGGGAAFAGVAQKIVTVRNGDLVKVNGTHQFCATGKTDGGNILCGPINANGTPYKRISYSVNVTEKGAYILKVVNGNPTAVVASRRHGR